MRLTQFWDKPTPPAEVAALIGTWRDDPHFRHELFNHETARDYIATHLGSDIRDAFDKCRLPAMQADLFRYCSLYVGGGLYIDADIANQKNAHDFFAAESWSGHAMRHFRKAGQREGAGVLMYRTSRKDGVRSQKITNDVMLAAGLGCRLFEAAIRCASENIAGETSQNVWLVTGPGVLNGLYRNEATRGLFQPYHQVSIIQVKRHLGFFWDLDYKKGEDDWRHSIRSGSGASIFAGTDKDGAS
ncbi:glycosyltransferase family 32 protein [Paracoccus aerodenitrificans]|uniref:glycosyltransferase family 32 protein n=1 Tax=Paracoccus aerodenitrificans TaxID=3017781 RepID=UPI0022EFFEBA|nr:glycosyltransferase [Paracoccus aerodenitrificans]WBU63237.1 glycosyltransferase [Paracoccus aerodenitrificans]